MIIIISVGKLSFKLSISFICLFSSQENWNEWKDSYSDKSFSEQKIVLKCVRFYFKPISVKDFVSIFVPELCTPVIEIYVSEYFLIRFFASLTSHP